MDGTEEDKAEFINDRIIESYKNYEPTLDRKVLPVLMRLYEQRVPKKYLPDIYKKIKTEFDGDYDKYADWLFANSQFTNLTDLMNLLKFPKYKCHYKVYFHLHKKLIHPNKND